MGSKVKCVLNEKRLACLRGTLTRDDFYHLKGYARIVTKWECRGQLSDLSLFMGSDIIILG